MHFATGIWIFSVIGIGLITMSGTTVRDISGSLKVTVGQNVSFMWNSDRNILTAAWGIRSGNLANPQYIFVDDSEVAVVNPSLEEKLKKRLYYVGNLAHGQAWFNISYATINDSNTYIAQIRENGSSTAKPYYVELNVSLSVSTTAPTVTTTTISVHLKLNSDHSKDSAQTCPGKKVEIVCAANGYPDPTYYWYNPLNVSVGENKTGAESKIIVYPFHGIWICYITNGVGQDIYHKVQMTVLPKDHKNCKPDLCTDGKLVGFVFGLLIAVVIIIVIIVVIYKKKKETRKPKNPEEIPCDKRDNSTTPGRGKPENLEESSCDKRKNSTNPEKKEWATWEKVLIVIGLIVAVVIIIVIIVLIVQDCL